MHDPFQNYQTFGYLGAYGINPAALAGHGLTTTPGIGAYGMYPE
jgi:hypothetical protein